MEDKNINDLKIRNFYESDTPLSDYIEAYADNNPVRVHMPGHKGKVKDYYRYDITETDEELALYGCTGIIKKSMENAKNIFNSGLSFYSAEGSTLAIKAMLQTAAMCFHKLNDKKRPVIIAARNVHRSFLDACALLDIRVCFIDSDSHFCKCVVSKTYLEEVLSDFYDYANKDNKQIEITDSIGNAICKDIYDSIIGVYITSPDYLGNICDIEGLHEVCKRHGKMLLVDNAHGAYLKFFDLHPINHGATMCADSAHKTLPVLTGGAYFHISEEALKIPDIKKYAKEALNIFASTSPSFLISKSLDSVNSYLKKDAEKDYKKTADSVRKLSEKLKKILPENIIVNNSDEPLKLVISFENSAMSGSKISEILARNNIYVEYADRDALVFMFTPFNSEDDYLYIENIMKKIVTEEQEKLQKTIENNIWEASYKTLSNNRKKYKIIPIRTAYFCETEVVNVDESLGRICANKLLSCPPAVPIIICGEKITKKRIDLIKYFGIKNIEVCKL